MISTTLIAYLTEVKTDYMLRSLKFTSTSQIEYFCGLVVGE